MKYSHTQQGTLIKVIMFMTMVLCLVIAGLNQFTSIVAISLYGVIATLIVLRWLFGSLTVVIDDEELRHYFGPKFWKKSYQLQEIEAVKQVRNSWIFGWGIRLTPHGWLYNVSGLDAVEIKLRSGRKFRIGTDDPQGIVDTISKKLLDLGT
jgi:hypothetical protein